MKFYHVINSKRGSGITVAAEIYDNDGAFSVDCAMSYCAPCEPTFSRPKGRMIARARLDSNKEMPAFKRLSFTTRNPQGLKMQILERLAGNVPISWANAIVNRELARLYAVTASKFNAQSTEIVTNKS